MSADLKDLRTVFSCERPRASVLVSLSTNQCPHVHTHVPQASSYSWRGILSASTLRLPPRNPGPQPSHGCLLPEKPKMSPIRDWDSLGSVITLGCSWIHWQRLQIPSNFRGCSYFQFSLILPSKIIPLLACPQGLGFPQKQNHDQLFPKSLKGSGFQMLV